MNHAAMHGTWRLRRMLVTTVLLMSLGACLSGRDHQSAKEPVNFMGPPASAAMNAPKATVKTAAKPAAKPTTVATKSDAAAPAAEGTTAMMMQPDLTKAAPVGKAETLTVTAQTLNIRARPHASAPVVGKLTRGSTLPVVVSAGWAKIGDDQYVLAKYLSRGEKSAKAPVRSLKAKSKVLAKTR